MLAQIVKLISVEDHPNAERLSINTFHKFDETEPTIVVSNKLDDGSHRYKVRQPLLFIEDGAIVPDYILKDGYWDEEKGQGILAGSKGNRVKPTNFRGIKSMGLVIPMISKSHDGYLMIDCEKFSGLVWEGEDLADRLGIVHKDSVK